MTLTPRQLATEVENAYHARDEETHRNMLARLTAAAGAEPLPVDLAHLTREQLEQRRNGLHVQLAAVNDHLGPMLRAHRGATLGFHADTLRPGDGMVGTLDPSE